MADSVSTLQAHTQESKQFNQRDAKLLIEYFQGLNNYFNQCGQETYNNNLINYFSNEKIKQKIYINEQQEETKEQIQSYLLKKLDLVKFTGGIYPRIIWGLKGGMLKTDEQIRKRREEALRNIEDQKLKLEQKIRQKNMEETKKKQEKLQTQQNKKIIEQQQKNINKQIQVVTIISPPIQNQVIQSYEVQQQALEQPAVKENEQQIQQQHQEQAKINVENIKNKNLNQLLASLENITQKVAEAGAKVAQVHDIIYQGKEPIDTNFEQFEESNDIINQSSQFQYSNINIMQENTISSHSNQNISLEEEERQEEQIFFQDFKQHQISNDNFDQYSKLQNNENLFKIQGINYQYEAEISDDQEGKLNYYEKLQNEENKGKIKYLDNQTYENKQLEIKEIEFTDLFSNTKTQQQSQQIRKGIKLPSIQQSQQQTNISNSSFNNSNIIRESDKFLLKLELESQLKQFQQKKISLQEFQEQEKQQAKLKALEQLSNPHKQHQEQQQSKDKINFQQRIEEQEQEQEQKEELKELPYFSTFGSYNNNHQIKKNSINYDDSQKIQQQYLQQQNQYQQQQQQQQKEYLIESGFGNLKNEFENQSPEEYTEEQEEEKTNQEWNYNDVNILQQQQQQLNSRNNMQENYNNEGQCSSEENRKFETFSGNQMNFQPQNNEEYIENEGEEELQQEFVSPPSQRKTWNQKLEESKGVNKKRDSSDQIITFDDDQQENLGKKQKALEEFKKKKQEEIEKMKEKWAKRKERETSPQLPSQSQQSQQQQQQFQQQRISSAKPLQPQQQQIPIQKLQQQQQQQQITTAQVFQEKKSRNSSIRQIEEQQNSPKQLKRTPSQINVKGVQKVSNKQLMKNALTNVCLAGDPNKKERDKAIQILQDSPYDNFVILFKGNLGRQDFRGLYIYDTVNEEIKKIYSQINSPNQLDSSMILNYYRYDSGTKEFKLIPSKKTFSLGVDAVQLYPQPSKSNYKII